MSQPKNGSEGLVLTEFSHQRFKDYCLGKLRSCPWSELDGLQPETKIINEKLGHVNTKGFLTINSQPAVNAEKSDSPSVGKFGSLASLLHTIAINFLLLLSNEAFIFVFLFPGYSSLLIDWLIDLFLQDGVALADMFIKRLTWSSSALRRS